MNEPHSLVGLLFKQTTPGGQRLLVVSTAPGDGYVILWYESDSDKIISVATRTADVIAQWVRGQRFVKPLNHE